MNYKEGDKARVRKDLVVDKTYGRQKFVDYMEPMLGEEVTIKRVNNVDKDYCIEEFGYFWTNEMLEPINDNNYEIHITTKGITTHAVMKKDGEIIKRSTTKLNSNDKFDFEYGANLCISRLFDENEENKKFKPYLNLDGSFYGEIGMPSNITALFGEPLFVGDMVECYNVNSKNKRKAFVIMANYNKSIGVMGIHLVSVDMKNGIIKTSMNEYQIRKVKSYKDLIDGEKDNEGVVAVLKEK